MREHAEKNGIWKKPVKSLISGFKARGQWMLSSMVAYLISKGVKLTKVELPFFVGPLLTTSFIDIASNLADTRYCTIR